MSWPGRNAICICDIFTCHSSSWLWKIICYTDFYNLLRSSTNIFLQGLRGLSIWSNAELFAIVLVVFLHSYSLMTLNVFEQAKPETVEKVCEIVKKQLALADGTPVTGESKFTALGADSLDTVSYIYLWMFSFETFQGHHLPLLTSEVFPLTVDCGCTWIFLSYAFNYCLINRSI